MKIEYIGKCLLLNNEDERILVIGDLHLGYEEAMNKSGVFVTREMYNEMIGELDNVFSDVGDVEKIVLLGDVKHAFSGNLKQEWQDVLKFIRYLKEKCGELIILRGNHDNYLVNIAEREGIKVLEEYFWQGFMFVHGDVDRENMYDKKVKYWIMGHAHPAIKISDGNKIEKYKCFLVGEYKGRKIIVLPSFFSLVIGSDVREDINLPWEFDIDKFEVKVVGENLEVLDFGKVNKIK
jgi:putative SbcD/Mre11-related phosphoesterase